MSYRIYVIGNGGAGRVTELQTWSGDDVLEIPLDSFARDAVLSIEPVTDVHEPESGA